MRLLPWRVLYEVLSRMEMAGSVRRGYFAEGLSGAQFALPEAAQLLQEIALQFQVFMKQPGIVALGKPA